jgi:hypothetical protein
VHVTREKIKTLAGTFDAEKLIKVSADGKRMVVWYSNQVPVFHLVRVELREGYSFQIAQMGTNGESVFPPDVKPKPYPFGPGGPFENAIRTTLGDQAADGGLIGALPKQ